MLDENTIDVALKAIKKALNESPNKQMSGASLGEFIPKVAPEVNVRDITGIRTGSGALAQFVRVHLSDTLRPVGEKGKDIVYEVYSSPQSLIASSDLIAVNQSESQSPFSPEIWNAFVRSNSSSVIFYDTELKQLKVCNQFNPLDHATLIKIPSVTADEFANMRVDFIKLIDDADKKDTLSQLDSELSYADWIEALRNLGFDEYKGWMEFRRAKIKSIFASRLSELSVPPEQHSALMDQLNQSQNIQSKKSKKSRINPTAMSHSSASLTSVENEVLFRRIALEVVSKMDITNLKQLSLPVGLVIEATLKN